jgi:tRNA A37 threonylcarbamoyladenosine dehydratase
LIGKDGIHKLIKAKVAVFGLGGVGSYVAEALCRAGVGSLLLVDKDIVDISNINRQLIALHSTVGRAKVTVAKERLLDINPNCQITTYELFFRPENKEAIDLSDCDYIIDAIDNVTAKLCLIELAKAINVPIISSLGTGNKLNPFLFEVTDISKTSVCPLAKVMRKELKNRGIKEVDVLYSTETPLTNLRPPGSISFVPSVAGLMIASVVVNNILSEV